MTDLLRRPNRPRCAAAVSAAAALALLVAGCSGEGGEEPSSSASASEASSSSSSAASSASPSDSTAPSPTESGSYEPATSEGPARNVPVPEMPDAVKEQTKEGLEAAVEYWWETASYLRESGDVGPYKGMSHESCGSCHREMERWSGVYGQGGWLKTDSPEIEVEVVGLDADQLGGTSILFLTSAPGSLYRPDGSLVEEAESDGSEDVPWSASLTFDEDAGHWLIDEMLPRDE